MPSAIAALVAEVGTRLQVGEVPGHQHSYLLRKRRKTAAHSCLFGAPSRAEVDKFFDNVDNAIQQKLSESSRKYNFDFARDEPLEGRWQWKPMYKATSTANSQSHNDHHQQEQHGVRSSMAHGQAITPVVRPGGVAVGLPTGASIDPLGARPDTPRHAQSSGPKEQLQQPHEQKGTSSAAGEVSQQH